MSRQLGIIYGFPALLRRTWADRYGRWVLIGLAMIVTPILIVHGLGRMYTLFPNLIPFAALNAFNLAVGWPLVMVMYGGILMIGVTGLAATAGRAKMQGTRTSRFGIATSLAVLAAILCLWIDDPADWWNVVSTGVVVAFWVSLLTRAGGWWALAIGSAAVIVAGILIGRPPEVPPRTASVIAEQWFWGHLPMIGVALFGVMVRKRLSTSSDRT